MYVFIVIFMVVSVSQEYIVFIEWWVNVELEVVVA
jgi:hypothetical protein